jgi:hypothetical protein
MAKRWLPTSADLGVWFILHCTTATLLSFTISYLTICGGLVVAAAAAS